MIDKYQKLSIWMSALALAASFVTGYFQYQSRQDSIEEKIKIELKMTHHKIPLNPLDLRVISGVEERKDLEAAILITNIGNTTIRILEVGYQDVDLPKHAFYADTEKAKILSPGEQAIFTIPDLAKEALINSTSSFRRTPEPSQIKHLDPGVRRGDELFSASLKLIINLLMTSN